MNQSINTKKKIVFDPNDKSDEFNDEYKKIHEEYKHLVRSTCVCTQHNLIFISFSFE